MLFRTALFGTVGAIVLISSAQAHGECASCAKTVELMGTENRILGAITTLEANISAVITKGVAQLSNNIKSQTEAMVRVQDEMNKDRITSDRQRGIGEARGTYRYNAADCSPSVAGLQAQNVSWMSGNMANHVSASNDRVFRGDKGTPAFTNAADAAAIAMVSEAKLKYCNSAMQEAKLCTETTEKFTSIPGIAFAGANMNAMTVMHPNLLAYDNSKEEQAANDFLRTIVDPVTPSSAIKDQRHYAYRMSRDAGLSVANAVVSKQIASRTKTFDVNSSQYTQFTDMQTRYLEGIKRPLTGKFSEREIIDMEINRRFGFLDWAKEVQRMDQNGLGRETVHLLAFQNYMLGRIADKLDEQNLMTASMLSGQRNSENRNGEGLK